MLVKTNRQDNIDKSTTIEYGRLYDELDVVELTLKLGLSTMDFQMQTSKTLNQHVRFFYELYRKWFTSPDPEILAFVDKHYDEADQDLMKLLKRLVISQGDTNDLLAHSIEAKRLREKHDLLEDNQKPSSTTINENFSLDISNLKSVDITHEEIKDDENKYDENLKKEKKSLSGLSYSYLFNERDYPNQRLMADAIVTGMHEPKARLYKRLKKKIDIWNKFSEISTMLLDDDENTGQFDLMYDYTEITDYCIHEFSDIVRKIGKLLSLGHFDSEGQKPITVTRLYALLEERLKVKVSSYKTRMGREPSLKTEVLMWFTCVDELQDDNNVPFTYKQILILTIFRFGLTLDSKSMPLLISMMRYCMLRWNLEDLIDLPAYEPFPVHTYLLNGRKFETIMRGFPFKQQLSPDTISTDMKINMVKNIFNAIWILHGGRGTLKTSDKSPVNWQYKGPNDNDYKHVISHSDIMLCAINLAFSFDLQNKRVYMPTIFDQCCVPTPRLSNPQASKRHYPEHGEILNIKLFDGWEATISLHDAKKKYYFVSKNNVIVDVSIWLANQFFSIPYDSGLAVSTILAPLVTFLVETSHALSTENWNFQLALGRAYDIVMLNKPLIWDFSIQLVMYAIPMLLGGSQFEMPDLVTKLSGESDFHETIIPERREKMIEYAMAGQSTLFMGMSKELDLVTTTEPKGYANFTPNLNTWVEGGIKAVQAGVDVAWHFNTEMYRWARTREGSANDHILEISDEPEPIAGTRRPNQDSEYTTHVSSRLEVGKPATANTYFQSALTRLAGSNADSSEIYQFKDPITQSIFPKGFLVFSLKYYSGLNSRMNSHLQTCMKIRDFLLNYNISDNTRMKAEWMMNQHIKSARPTMDGNNLRFDTYPTYSSIILTNSRLLLSQDSDLTVNGVRQGITVYWMSGAFYAQNYNNTVNGRTPLRSVENLLVPIRSDWTHDMIVVAILAALPTSIYTRTKKHTIWTYREGTVADYPYAGVSFPTYVDNTGSGNTVNFWHDNRQNYVFDGSLAIYLLVVDTDWDLKKENLHENIVNANYNPLYILDRYVPHVTAAALDRGWSQVVRLANYTLSNDLRQAAQRYMVALGVSWEEYAAASLLYELNGRRIEYPIYGNLSEVYNSTTFLNTRNHDDFINIRDPYSAGARLSHTMMNHFNMLLTQHHNRRLQLPRHSNMVDMLYISGMTYYPHDKRNADQEKLWHKYLQWTYEFGSDSLLAYEAAIPLSEFLIKAQIPIWLSQSIHAARNTWGALDLSVRNREYKLKSALRDKWIDSVILYLQSYLSDYILPMITTTNARSEEIGDAFMNIRFDSVDPVLEDLYIPWSPGEHIHVLHYEDLLVILGFRDPREKFFPMKTLRSMEQVIDDPSFKLTEQQKKKYKNEKLIYSIGNDDNVTYALMLPDTFYAFKKLMYLVGNHDSNNNLADMTRYWQQIFSPMTAESFILAEDVIGGSHQTYAALFPDTVAYISNLWMTLVVNQSRMIDAVLFTTKYAAVWQALLYNYVRLEQRSYNVPLYFIQTKKKDILPLKYGSMAMLDTMNDMLDSFRQSHQNVPKNIKSSEAREVEDSSLSQEPAT